MEKPTSSKFVVENKLDNSLVDVEVIPNRVRDELIPPLDDEETELELEDLDIVQLRESAAHFTDAIPMEAAKDDERGWRQAHTPSSRSALVLYPKPQTNEYIEEHETVISMIPPISDTLSSKRRTLQMAISYLAVATVSILGTLLVVGWAKAPEQVVEPPEQVVEPPMPPAALHSTPRHVAAVIPVATPTEAPVVESQKTSGRHDAPRDEAVDDNRHTPEKKMETNAPVLSAVVTKAGASEVTDQKTDAKPDDAKHFKDAKTAPTPIGERVSATDIAVANTPEQSDLDAVVPTPTQPVAQEPAPALELPSREMVRETMKNLAPEVQKCKKNISGRAVGRIKALLEVPVRSSSFL